jgi:hypothetical protein
LTFSFSFVVALPTGKVEKAFTAHTNTPELFVLVG